MRVDATNPTRRPVTPGDFGMEEGYESGRYESVTAPESRFPRSRPRYRAGQRRGWRQANLRHRRGRHEGDEVPGKPRRLFPVNGDAAFQSAHAVGRTIGWTTPFTRRPSCICRPLTRQSSGGPARRALKSATPSASANGYRKFMRRVRARCSAANGGPRLPADGRS